MLDPYLQDWLPWPHTQSTPTALYIHMPWCVKKCPYCDFNAHAIRGQTFPESDYVSALLTEMATQSAVMVDRCIVSVFFGGGTPSLFKPSSIAKLIDAIHQSFQTLPELEITMEANPGTTDQQHFRGYRQAGVSRLSLGIQSFDAKHLKRLGRIHDDRQAHQAIEDAQHANFDNINIDLMFGLPEQTLSEAMHDLEQGIAIDTTHVSWYELTIEPHTAFAYTKPKLPHHDLQADMALQGHRHLANAGFEQYEISAFAKAKNVCQHNVHVWQFGDYLGIGAGAHSKLTTANGVVRQYRHHHPKYYLKATDKIACQNTIPLDALPFEYLMNRLRLHRPISLTHMRQHATPDTTIFQKAAEMGLMTQLDNGDWHTTSMGRHMHNDLLMLCMPSEV